MREPHDSLSGRTNPWDLLGFVRSDSLSLADRSGEILDYVRLICFFDAEKQSTTSIGAVVPCCTTWGWRLMGGDSAEALISSGFLLTEINISGRIETS